MSDSEARLRIVLDAINNAGSELKRLQDDLKKTGEGAKTAKGGFGELAGKFEELTGVGIPTAVTLGGVGAAVGAVYQIVSDSVGRFGEYAEQVRDLSYAYNLSAEQASELIQVLDDARVAPASLQTAFRTMTDKGIQPTIENLANLADEFVSIQDPIEKAAFLSEKFGARAGPEMAKALGLGGDALRRYAEDARDAGLLLTNADLAAAERLKQAQDALADTQIQFDRNVGLYGTMVQTELLDVSVDALQQIGTWWDALFPKVMSHSEWVQETGRAYAELTDEADRELRRLTDVNNDTATSVEIAMQRQTVAAEKLQAAYGLLSMALGSGMTKENEKYEDSQADLEQQALDLRTEIDRLKGSHGQYFETVQGNGMSTAELALATEKLAAAQRNLAEETDPLKAAQLAVEIERQQEAIAGADKVVGGYIDNSGKISELEGEYAAIEDAIKALADEHDKATKRMLFNMLQQKLAADGITTEEYNFLMRVAKGYGLIDQAAYDAGVTMNRIADEAATTGKWGEAAGKVFSYTNALLGIPTSVSTDVITRYVTQGTPSGVIGDENYGGWTPPPNPNSPPPSTTSNPAPGVDLEPGVRQQSTAPGGSTVNNVTVNTAASNPVEVAQVVAQAVARQAKNQQQSGVW